jgi:ATP-dependent Zn protease
MTNDDTASQLANIMSLIGSAVIIVLFGGTLLFQIRKFFSNPARIVRAGKNAIGFADVAGQKEAKDSFQ